MRLCTVEGCDREHYARSLCSMHYQQHRRGRIANPAPRRGMRPFDESVPVASVKRLPVLRHP